MENLADIFNDDAFNLVSMTAAVNQVSHIPGRAGELAFVGAGQGVATTTALIESSDSILSLIQTSERGAPAPRASDDKRTVRSVDIPQIKLEDGLGALEVGGVRAFGSNKLAGAKAMVDTRLKKLGYSHDLTLEYHRLGALKGQILDADATVLTDLFQLFGVTNDNTATGGGATDASPKVFAYDFGSSDPVDVRVTNQAVIRFIRSHAKMLLPGTAQVWAFCGDGFFDALVSRPDVKDAYRNGAEQQDRLGNNLACSTFEHGGIVFENYHGTDDGTTVGIASDEARVFLTGVPGLYAEYFAPADFYDTVNTLGLPRYARVAADGRFNQRVDLHAQQNPLPLCLRPQTLGKLVIN